MNDPFITLEGANEICGAHVRGPSWQSCLVHLFQLDPMMSQITASQSTALHGCLTFDKELTAMLIQQLSRSRL